MSLKTIPKGVKLPINKGVDYINEGIKASERAENKSDEALLTAKTAKASADSTRTELDAVIGRETDSDAMSRQAAVDAKGVDKVNLKKRLDDEYNEVSELLAESEQEIEKRATKEEYMVSPSVVSAFWEPPTQPPARSRDTEGSFADYYISGAQDVYDLYEELKNTDPDYIHRTLLGKDASVEYDVWRYVFAPERYEKTLILTSGNHGTEAAGVFGLYRFLYEVVHNWKRYPQLSYIRHKVRLIVVPVQNPWGFSQRPKVYQNSNGVNLNRNYSVGWQAFPNREPWEQEYKGTAPFSEPESQYTRDTLALYSNAIAHLDFHDYPTGSETADYPIFLPEMYGTNRNIYNKLLRHMEQNNLRVNWVENNFPTPFNYSASLGLHAATPEVCVGNYGDRWFDSTEMTAYVRWYGNVILQHAILQNKAKVDIVTEPFIKKLYYVDGGSSLTRIPVGSTYQEIPNFNFEFDIPVVGYVRFSGEIVLYKNNPEDEVYWICPKLGQSGQSYFGDDKIRSEDWEVYSAGARRTIPFSAEIPVYPTSNTYGKCKVGLYARMNTGLAVVARFRGAIEFTPSFRGDRVEVYRGSDSAGYSKWYPR